MVIAAVTEPSELSRSEQEREREPSRCARLVEPYTASELSLLAQMRNAGIELSAHETDVARCANAGYR